MILFISTLIKIRSVSWKDMAERTLLKFSQDTNLFITFMVVGKDIGRGRSRSTQKYKKLML